VFHAGTREAGAGVVSSGGRVLTLSAVGTTRAQARERAYDALSLLRLEGGQWRRDIGATPRAANLQENR